MVGPIGDSFVCHHCDVPDCVNPEHLFLGTAADNSRDMVLKERSTRGVDICTAKLTPSAVNEIRRLARAGVRRRIIADEFGVTREHVQRIIRGDYWAWL